MSSNKSVLNETKRKGKRTTGRRSKSQRLVSETYTWTYNRIKNYGQLDLPEDMDNLFLLKIKIDCAELLLAQAEEVPVSLEGHEWRVRVDVSGTDLTTQTFRFDSEGKYSPNRKLGVLIRMRSNLEKFTQFLSEQILRVHVESLQNKVKIYSGEIPINLSQFLDSLNEGMTAKWRRIIRDVKLSSELDSDFPTDLKLSLLLSLCNDGQCCSSDAENGSGTERDTRSGSTSSSSSLQPILQPIGQGRLLSVQQRETIAFGEDGALDRGDQKLMSQTLNSSRTKKLKKIKNPRISVGRLTLLSNDLEDKTRELQRLKELHENEISELTRENQKVSDELEILRAKILADGNKNIGNNSTEKADAHIQTDNGTFPLNNLNDKNDKENCSNEMDDIRVKGKAAMLDNIISEYHVKLDSLNIKSEAMKLQNTKSLPRFPRAGRNYRETIAKKQELKRIIDNNNIFEFIQHDLCDAVIVEIRNLETEIADLNDDTLRMKLEKEIHNKKELLSAVDAKK